MRTRFVLAAPAGLVCVAVAGCGSEPFEAGVVKRADSAAVEALVHEARGGPLVVNVWATWCEPCVAETPELVAFHQSKMRGNAVFLSFSIDMPEHVDTRLPRFMEEQGIPFTVHALDGVPPDELVEALGITLEEWDGALPATFVFDAEGRLVSSWYEEVSADDLLGALSGLV